MSVTSPELKFHIVRAGAGAGKTRGLVEKVVEVFRLYTKSGLLPRIVVTTFTRKATQELKERLILKACEEKDAALLQFASDPSKLQISTIHGLLNSFLRQVGHLAGLDAGFQLMSAGESESLARIALREAVLSQPEGLRWLEIYGFQRVLDMCRRFETLKREQGGLRPSSLEDLQALASVAIQKWKREISEFARMILEEVDHPKWTHFAQELLAFSSSWSGDGGALDDLPSKPRMSKDQAGLEVWHERAKDLLDAFKDEVKRPSWDTSLWEQMGSAWRDFAELAEEFSRIYLGQKEAQARFELADLELKTIEILREKPFLGSIFSENWDFWMIDEYQDTSPLQVACLEALISGKPTYYVGDPQQSIYLFRGAEVKVFDQAELDVSEKGGVKIELRRNYRSQPDLLNWINDFMTSVSDRFSRMEPRDLEQNQPSRSCVQMIKACREEQEMVAVVATVERLISSGSRPDQICVLGRTHRTLLDVSRALRERGFPTHVHASRGFSARREVVDAQALWKFLVNPHDNTNLMVLLRSPWFYIEDSVLREWTKSRPPSLWHYLLSKAEVPDAIMRLRLASARSREEGLASAFEEVLCSSAYLDLSLVNDPAGRKESNLWKLIHKARMMEKEGGHSVLDFLESGAGGDLLDVTEGDATSAQEPNSINLMTVHGSKGLEFDHVIVPRMGESPRTSSTPPLDAIEDRFFFPLWDEETGKFIPSLLDEAKVREQRAKELEEFDRWLYVALTRAKSHLVLIWSDVGRDSWAARSDFFSLESGLHSRHGYTFEVIHQEFEAGQYQGKAESHQEVRQPWATGNLVEEDKKSVTDLIATKPFRGRDADLLSRWQAQSLGTRIHRSLESLKYSGKIPSENEEAIEFVLNLQDPPMRKLIEAGEVEWGFQVQTPSRVVEGQIDLWGEVENRIYVVDYKSGTPKGKDMAFEQLSLYAWALRKFGHQKPIELVVIYPLSAQVERCDFKEELFLRWELEFGRSKT